MDDYRGRRGGHARSGKLSSEGRCGRYSGVVHRYGRDWFVDRDVPGIEFGDVEPEGGCCGFEGQRYIGPVLIIVL